MSGPVKDPLRALQGARSRAQGGRLEEQIEASCALLTETGRADISKTPEPMKPVSQPNKSGQFRAVYTKKAEPDFKGVMLGGRAVMFEAKSTGTGRLNKDRVLPEQVKKLDSYTALGAHCFIVATFDGLRVYRIPWTVWRSMKQRYGRNYVTEADIKEYAVRFGPGFTPDLLRGIPTMYDINPLSNVSDVLTAFCGMPYGTQPETEEWRAAVYRFNRFMNWTTPERFVLVDEIRRERQNMENPIFTFMGVPITEEPGPHSTNCRTETKRRSTMTEQEIVMMAAEVAAKAAVAAVRAILGKEIQESVEAAVTDAARLGAEASIKAVEQERKKFRDGRSDRRFRNTKLLLRNYTVLNANCSHAVYDAASAATGEESVEEIVEALDELLEENLKVESIMKSAARTQLIMRHVNRMLGIYKVVCENSVDEGEQRHYRVIEALYLRDRPLSPTAVAEREKIDKRTVYKDVDAACATLSALIFGIDGIKKA